MACCEVIAKIRKRIPGYLSRIAEAHNHIRRNDYIDAPEEIDFATIEENPKAMREKAVGEIRGTYSSDRQYLAFPYTKKGRNDLNTRARRWAGVDSWQLGERFFHIVN